jgi:DNA-binding response OmpR family regulator
VVFDSGLSLKIKRGEWSVANEEWGLSENVMAKRLALHQQNGKAILLVEDNPHILKVNRAMLERAGYQVLCAKTASEARALIRQQTFDLLILDIMLPDGDGVALCRELRAPQDNARTAALPILFLSAKRESNDIVAGLQAGGDDYLPKPYNLSVLLARVEALLRRADKHSVAAAAPQMLKRGSLTLELTTMRALVRDNDILLTPKEFLVLLALVENEGKVLDKDTLYQRVWGQPMENDSQALYAVVSRLKRKLKPCGDGLTLTAARLDGYKLEFKASEGRAP